MLNRYSGLVTLCMPDSIGFFGHCINTRFSIIIIGLSRPDALINAMML